MNKSDTSVRQMIRNPSGRLVVALSIALLVGVVVWFFLIEFGDIKDKFDNRPKLAVVTAGPPPHRWSTDQALDFFREYAIARPAPADHVQSDGLATCWDFALALSSDSPASLGDLVPFHMGTNPNSIIAPQARPQPLWGINAGDISWRFWENTLSVVGPC